MTTKKVTPDNATPQDAGRLLHRALDHDGVPDFIMGAIIIALRVACERLGESLPAWLADDQGDDGASLMALFERVPRVGFDFTLEPPRDLAELISAVLKHPETPADLYNALAEQTTSMSNAIDHDSPEHLRLTLAYYARREREAAG